MTQHNTELTTEQGEATVKHIQDDGTVTIVHPDWITAREGYLAYGNDGEKVRLPWRRVVETREPYGDE